MTTISIVPAEQTAKSANTSFPLDQWYVAGFSSELTYAGNETYRYYITEDGKTEVPAILALTWASGSGTLEEVAANAKNTGNLRFCYGISEQQYADRSAAGKRLASNIATITVVHGT